MKILLVYSTTDGHTLRICTEIQKRLESLAHQCKVIPVSNAFRERLDEYDRIVIGASIRYGHHSPEIETFILENQSILEKKRSGFFSVNLVARKTEKRTPETNPYARKFLRRISWKPHFAEVFAGKLDYPRYPFFDRHIIRLIMWLTQGPTDPTLVVEYTDWQQVTAFAEKIPLA